MVGIAKDLEVGIDEALVDRRDERLKDQLRLQVVKNLLESLELTGILGSNTNRISLCSMCLQVMQQ